jgi:hypothetical protein
VWRFNSDGTFTFAPANARDDLYPLKGNFKVNGNRLTYSASAESRIGNTGSASANIRGEITLDSTTAKVTVDWSNSAGSAAVVSNTPFASASSSAYKIEATLISED